MARYTGPKHKLARKEGVNVLEKVNKSLERRLNVLPGLHGKMRRRKLSEYGMQLREKQKLKAIYGLLERQFARYMGIAQKKSENTEEVLIQLLETRLDNIVYRLGFANSRAQARQFVSHRHVFVNKNIVNIPSYQVKEGEVIALDPKLAAKLKSEEVEEEVTKSIPAYLNKDEKKGGKLLHLPKSEDVVNPVDYQLVIEYYSR